MDVYFIVATPLEVSTYRSPPPDGKLLMSVVEVMSMVAWGNEAMFTPPMLAVKFAANGTASAGTSLVSSSSANNLARERCRSGRPRQSLRRPDSSCRRKKRPSCSRLKSLVQRDMNPFLRM